jgi:RimJ/RimL family protein N-acetyltransferase
MHISTSMPRTAREWRSRPTLETERLILRPMRRSDVDAIVALAGDEAVAAKTASIPYPLTYRQAEGWLDRHLREDSGKEVVFAIEHKADRVFLGAIGLMIGGPRQPAPMGYWLGRPFWNQGYMTEAIRRLLDHAFADLEVIAVRAAAYPDNPASMRVQEKAGMTFIGREIEPAPARGGDRVVLVREITRTQWLR